MRFAVLKSKEGMLSLHRTRKLLQRTGQLHRRARSAQNRAGVNQLVIRDDDRLPDETCLAAPVDLLGWEKIAELEKALRKWHRNSEISQQLEKIPGVGMATALTATLGDGKQTVGSSRRRWCRVRTVPAARHGSEGSRNRAIRTCAAPTARGRLRKNGHGSPQALVETVNQGCRDYRQPKRCRALVRTGERATGSSTTQAQRACPEET